MLRIKLFRILYGDDNCNFFIQKLNKDCLNNIAAFLCIGFTLNNESINSIKLIQEKPYTFHTFKHILSTILNVYETLDDKIGKIRQCEIVYRYINMYYSKVASYTTSYFTTICYNKAKILQMECITLYNDENNKIIHNYNTRKNLKMKEELHKLNILCEKFTREIEPAIYYLGELNKKYPIIPPGMWF